MLTIGVSVAVPEPGGSRLQTYRKALGDPQGPLVPSHVTLVPPQEVESARLPEIEEHLSSAAVSVAPFEAHLRGTGTFRPVSPVVFVTVASGISGFERLEAQVRRGPLAVPVRYPYHPHVTVGHHLDDDLLDRAFEELAGFDERFWVREFWLYLNDDDAGWQPARRFALTGE